MTKIGEYKNDLDHTEDWDAYLLAHSGLPGPRANLELIYAAADVADEARLLAYCAIPRAQAPVDSPPVFLVCCGVVGLGKLVNQGQTDYFQRMRAFASDDRWRVREAVAMALQTVGDAGMQPLLDELRSWQAGNPLEQRAVVAALCEPRLLTQQAVAEQVLRILDDITNAFSGLVDRKRDDFVVLKKGLSYGWSVAVVADPATGKSMMEKWIASPDKDVCAVMKENLKKNRLLKMDPAWVSQQLNRLAGA